MDIYFKKEYGELYVQDNEELNQIIVTENDSCISYIFIKRFIKEVDGIEYYDIVTPYGYGGPVYVGTITKALVEKFIRKYTEYIEKNNIVSEFIRFHPLEKNALYMKNIYEPIFCRKTIATEINTELAFDEVLKQQISKSSRKTINKLLKQKIQIQFINQVSKNDLNKFIDIYYSTMDRNSADSSYYFTKKYFREMLEFLPNDLLLINVIYDKKNIAAALCLKGNGILHVHLSGTLSEYINISPAYLLKYAEIKWAYENKYFKVHYGGGKTNSEDDSLFLFKKKFAQNSELNDFYIAKKIHNLKIYNQLIMLNGIKKTSDFFPAYRDQ